jgi:hypothetical protein
MSYIGNIVKNMTDPDPAFMVFMFWGGKQILNQNSQIRCNVTKGKVGGP